MLKCFSLIFTAMLLICSNIHASEVLLDKPRGMETVFHGKPERSYHNIRSKIVPAKPNTWYRLSVDIKCAFKPGKGSLKVNVRNIRKNGKSIVYSEIVKLAPAFLEFNHFTGIFLTTPETASLQVYYHLIHMDGYAEFKNLRLEELSAEEAEKARKALDTKPAYFSAPVYAYSGETSLPWGYRISADLLKKEDIPAKITFALPELGILENAEPELNKHAVYKAALKNKLACGKYKIIMSALGKNGKVLEKQESFLRVINRPVYAKRLPVKSVAIDDKGNTLINGKAVLLNGLYHVYTAEEFRQVADAGFNSVLAWTDKPDTYLKMLDNMKACDLYADCVLKLVKDEKLQQTIKAIGGHETIISFDPVDEPDIRNVTPERIMETVNQVKKLFPNRLTRISLAGATYAKNYVSCVDIMAAHDYVIPFGGLPHLAKTADEVVKVCGKGKSPQLTLQSWIHWHDPKRVPQTPEQTVAMAYLSLIHGAKGLWWYSFIDHGTWDVRTVPSIWTTFKGLNAQLNELSDVILTGKRLPVKSNNDMADCAVWETAKRSILAVVNKGKNKADVQLSGIPGSKVKELFADNEEYSVKSGKTVIRMNAESARVFEID